jgi:hypothetical protein
MTPRRPGRHSQCEKLLRILADGDWHTTSELLRAVPCIVHSRISELRKFGWDVEHVTTGAGADGSRYRLLNPAEVPSSPSPRRGSFVCHVDESAGMEEQLALVDNTRWSVRV